MSQFAKLYEPESGRQILVMKDTNENGGPALSYLFCPEGLGVCCVKFGFSDDECGWDKLDEAFDGVTQESATQAVDRVASGLSQQFKAKGE